jgi:hypothetical protein
VLSLSCLKKTTFNKAESTGSVGGILGLMLFVGAGSWGMGVQHMKNT